MASYEQRYHDVGIPEWPVILVGDSHVRVVGMAPTIGGTIAAWTIVAALCFAAWAAITWFSFGYAFRTCDWYGYYMIPPKREEIWGAVIVSGVTSWFLHVLARKHGVAVVAQMFGSVRSVVFTDEATYIPGATIENHDSDGIPIALSFWMNQGEEIEAALNEAQWVVSKHVYSQAFEVEVIVKSRISQTSIPFTRVLTQRAASQFVSVCNAAYRLSQERGRQTGNDWEVID